MRRIIILSLLCLAGCQNVIGPFAPRPLERVDAPCLSISEQENRARDRYAIPEDSPRVAPPSGAIYSPGR